MPRPSLPRSARRVPINARVSPETAADIRDLIQRLDVKGQGEALDLLATEARRTASLRILVHDICSRVDSKEPTTSVLRMLLGYLPSPAQLDALDPAGGDEAADH